MAFSGNIERLPSPSAVHSAIHYYISAIAGELNAILRDPNNPTGKTLEENLD